MLADLAEYHAPDDTQQLNAAVVQMADQVQAISRTLSIVEDKLLDDNADVKRMREDFNQRATPQPLSKSISNVARMKVVLRGFVTREQWAAPVHPNNGIPEHLAKPVHRLPSDLSESASSIGTPTPSVSRGISGLLPRRVSRCGRSTVSQIRAARGRSVGSERESSDGQANAPEMQGDVSADASVEDADGDPTDPSKCEEQEDISLFAEATERLMVRWEDEAKQHGWSSWG